MAGKKKAAAKAADDHPRDATSVPETADTREPHEINPALGSDRMKALLEDHRRMGARPGPAK